MGQVLHGSAFGMGHGGVCLGVIQRARGKHHRVKGSIRLFNQCRCLHDARGFPLIHGGQHTDPAPRRTGAAAACIAAPIIVRATRRAYFDARLNCQRRSRRRSRGPSVPRPYRAPGQSAASRRRAASQFDWDNLPKHNNLPKDIGDVGRIQLRTAASHLVPVTSLFYPAGPETFHQRRPGEGLAAELNVVDVRVTAGKRSIPHV